MSDNVPPEQEIGIAFSGAVFYGIYLLTFAQSLRWQLFTDEGWSIRRKPHWTMIVITIAIFALTTSYLSLLLFRNTQTLHDILNHIPSTVPEGRVPWTTTVICILANSTALLADTALVYRCWVVYGKSRRIIIFPAVMWLAGFVCTILQAYWQFVQSNADKKWKWVNMSIGPGMILTPFWATTLALNAYTMFALVHRIRGVAKRTNEVGNARSLQSTAIILVESGFLYFSTTFVHFIVWFTPNDLAIRVASGINIPTIGIAFNLILIRVGQKRAMEHSKAASSNGGLGSSDIRYARNSSLLSSRPEKIIIDISQETTMMTTLHDGSESV